MTWWECLTLRTVQCGELLRYWSVTVVPYCCAAGGACLASFRPDDRTSGQSRDPVNARYNSSKRLIYSIHRIHSNSFQEQHEHKTHDGAGGAQRNTSAANASPQKRLGRKTPRKAEQSRRGRRYMKGGTAAASFVGEGFRAEMTQINRKKARNWILGYPSL